MHRGQTLEGTRTHPGAPGVPTGGEAGHSVQSHPKTEGKSHDSQAGTAVSWAQHKQLKRGRVNGVADNFLKFLICFRIVCISSEDGSTAAEINKDLQEYGLS